MKNRKIYSKEFKETRVEKMINRGDRTIISICEEAFVLLGTEAKWIVNRALLPVSQDSCRAKC